MKLAAFPAVSPWARRRLTPEDHREIREAQPADLRVIALVDASGVFVTVKLQRDGVNVAEATARNTIDAFRQAVAKVTGPEIASVLS